MEIIIMTNYTLNVLFRGAEETLTHSNSPCFDLDLLSLLPHGQKQGSDNTFLQPSSCGLCRTSNQS